MTWQNVWVPGRQNGTDLNDFRDTILEFPTSKIIPKFIVQTKNLEFYLSNFSSFENVWLLFKQKTSEGLAF